MWHRCGDIKCSSSCVNIVVIIQEDGCSANVAGSITDRLLVSLSPRLTITCWEENTEFYQEKIFLCSKTSWPAPGRTQPPIRCVPAFFPGRKAAGRNVNFSPPSSAKVKNEWNYTSTPPMHHNGLDREKFTFLLYVLLQLKLTVTLQHFEDWRSSTL
jgi:hypothetical protein